MVSLFQTQFDGFLDIAGACCAGSRAAENRREEIVGEVVITKGLWPWATIKWIAATIAGAARPLLPIVATRVTAAASIGLVVRTQLVKQAALFWVAQHLMGFVDLFELFLGCFIAQVGIWVMLASQFAIRLFNSVRIGGAF